MVNKNPPFEITGAILSDVVRIAELVGKVSTARNLSSNPTLRRTNRIKTIYSSLAIEQNTLSLDQVTALLAGKRVIAPPKDIMEVKNAYEIYDRMDSLDPYSVDDLLAAHGVMTRDLTRESGVFRASPVGVVDKDGNILHFGTLPQYVPKLVSELFDWTRESDIHMLIKSCVFHYEFELIHPFADGNGRIGRLWHTLLLSKWKPFFAWLPVESIIHDRQDEYYAAINNSNIAGESTQFIEFMLSAIKAALVEADAEKTASPLTKKEDRWSSVYAYLQKSPVIMNADVRNLFGVSSATANRILSGFVKDSKLKKIHSGHSWGYELNK